MLSRKVMPERLTGAWAAFAEQAQRVEAARLALLRCLPVGRVDPAPVPVGLELVRDELRAVAWELDAWRVPEVEAEWHAVGEAVADADAAVDGALRVATSTRELEQLLEAVGEVVEPLDAWSRAERAWLRQRVRAGRARAAG